MTLLRPCCIPMALLVVVMVAWSPWPLSSAQPPVRAQTKASVSMNRLERPGLPNLIQLGTDVFAGGEPRGEVAFRSLKRLGVRTLISVDGVRPAVESARRHGIRYVHIPIGYDQIPRSASEMLTRVVRERPGPYYVHCHHGHHRGPAAAAVMCVAAKMLPAREAESILRFGGTSREYLGLWRDVRRLELPPIGAALPELVEVAQVDAFAASMAQIDRLFAKLSSSRGTGWSRLPSVDRRDTHTALLLTEHFRELGRATERPDSPSFRDALTRAERDAAALLAALKASDSAGADARFKRLSTACAQCHSQFRN